MVRDRQLQIIKVKLFASYKELIGKSEIMLEIKENATVADLKKMLSSNYPEISQDLGAIYAVNHKVVDDSTMLSDNDEIAVFPPVSGGI